MKKRLINIDIFKKRNKKYVNEESSLFQKKNNKNNSKYKCPSLIKYEFTSPQIQTTRNIKFPLLEEKKVPASISLKTLFLNKKEINKDNYERITPSFRLSPELSCLEKIKEYEKLRKRLRNYYDVIKKQQLKKGGDTTERFFNSITKSVLGHNNISVKHIGSFSFRSPLYLINDEINNRKDCESLNDNNSFNLFKNKLLKQKIHTHNNKIIFDGRYSKNFQSVKCQLRSLSDEKSDKDFLNTEQVINKILKENKY